CKWRLSCPRPSITSRRSFERSSKKYASGADALACTRHLSRNAAFFDESGVGINGAVCGIGNLFSDVGSLTSIQSNCPFSPFTVKSVELMRKSKPLEQCKLISSALAEPAIVQTAAYAPSPSIESLNISQRSL